MKDALPSSETARRPRVLVSSYRSHPHVGGQGIYVRQLSRALHDKNCDVTVVSGPPYPELDPGIALEKLPSLDLFEAENAFLAFRPRILANKADRTEWLAHNTFGFGEMTSFGLRLEAFIAEHGSAFDVIIDNQTLSDPMVRIAEQIPLITVLHHPIAIDRDVAVANAGSWWRAALASRWHSFITAQARAVKALPHFLAVSEAARESYRERCGLAPEKAMIGLNGINHDNFYADPQIVRDDNHIVAVASADVPVKGLDILIDALGLLRDRNCRPQLTVVGTLREGPTKRAIKAQKLTEQVQFVSGLSDPDMADLFRRASVFVSPSRFEGFGFPPAEAMACGAPVIVSTGGALPEVAGDAGIVVPVEDPDALADAIETVLNDDALRHEIGQRCAERARNAFRWDIHAQAALDLYERATKTLEHTGAHTP